MAVSGRAPADCPNGLTRRRAAGVDCRRRMRGCGACRDRPTLVFHSPWFGFRFGPAIPGARHCAGGGAHRLLETAREPSPVPHQRLDVRRANLARGGAGDRGVDTRSRCELDHELIWLHLQHVLVGAAQRRHMAVRARLRRRRGLLVQDPPHQGRFQGSAVEASGSEGGTGSRRRSATAPTAGRRCSSRRSGSVRLAGSISRVSEVWRARHKPVRIATNQPRKAATLSRQSRHPCRWHGKPGPHSLPEKRFQPRRDRSACRSARWHIRLRRGRHRQPWLRPHALPPGCVADRSSLWASSFWSSLSRVSAMPLCRSPGPDLVNHRRAGPPQPRSTQTRRPFRCRPAQLL